ncbi:MAG: HEAT repeat domain-containing protein [Methanomicrobiales archaeon]|nr:HEAT repeat domain-containing protein [Methanomicrobiales archaeon]
MRSLKERNTQEERTAIIIALGKQGDPRAVEPLIECLEDPDPSIRRLCIEALYRLSSTRSVPALVRRLNDRNEEWLTRTYAAEALGRIGSATAVESLNKLLLDRNEDPFTRIYVMDVLCRNKFKGIVDVLMKCLRDADPRIRKAAVKSLGSI